MLDVELTDRQQEMFDFIVDTIEEYGYGPSIREIADWMEYRSPNGVMRHLHTLEDLGLIERTNNLSRAIALTDAVIQERQGLPLSGRVQAGVMTEAVEQTERIDIGSLWPQKGSYLLKVEGNSMIDAQIASGDYVVVKKRRTASAGDMVIARTSDGEATLKYWFPEKKRIRLQPANKRMKPIYTRDAKVIGVVVGVIRQL